MFRPESLGGSLRGPRYAHKNVCLEGVRYLRCVLFQNTRSNLRTPLVQLMVALGFGPPGCLKSQMSLITRRHEPTPPTQSHAPPWFLHSEFVPVSRCICVFPSMGSTHLLLAPLALGYLWKAELRTHGRFRRYCELLCQVAGNKLGSRGRCSGSDPCFLGFKTQRNPREFWQSRFDVTPGFGASRDCQGWAE